MDGAPGPGRRSPVRGRERAWTPWSPTSEKKSPGAGACRPLPLHLEPSRSVAAAAHRGPVVPPTLTEAPQPFPRRRARGRPGHGAGVRAERGGAVGGGARRGEAFPTETIPKAGRTWPPGRALVRGPGWLGDGLPRLRDRDRRTSLVCGTTGITVAAHTSLGTGPSCTSAPQHNGSAGCRDWRAAKCSAPLRSPNPVRARTPVRHASWPLVTATHGW